MAAFFIRKRSFLFFYHSLFAAAILTKDPGAGVSQLSLQLTKPPARAGTGVRVRTAFALSPEIDLPLEPSSLFKSAVVFLSLLIMHKGSDFIWGPWLCSWLLEEMGRAVQDPLKASKPRSGRKEDRASLCSIISLHILNELPHRKTLKITGISESQNDRLTHVRIRKDYSWTTVLGGLVSCKNPCLS